MIVISGLVAVFSVGFGRVSAQGAPVSFNTALPVTEGQWIFRAQLKYIRSSGDPTPSNRKLRVLAVPLVGVYGVSEKLALFGIFPLLDKSLYINTPSGRVNRGVSGPGDASFLARYTLFKRDLPGQTFRLAPFVGVEAPTGKDDEEDALGKLPRPLQLGSGSWDPATGMVATWQTLSWEVDAAVSYKLNTKADGFKFGDEARVDFSYQYRAWPQELSSGVPAYVYAVIESNLTWKGKNEIAGVRDGDSGGVVWNVAPGIQYVTRKFIVEGAIQFPLIQNLNGNGLENDFATTLSVRANF